MSSVLLVTADPELREHVLAVAAAVAAEVDLRAEVAELRRVWREPAMVVVGVDRAAEVVDLALPRRSEVYLVGREVDRDDTHLWSVPLGAAVVTFPDEAHHLASMMTYLTTGPHGTGRTVCVLGASGGVGVSTIAAGLAVSALRGGHPAMLVDADPDGGGIDLLLGAERTEGWRWGRLASARGHLGDLTGQLPRVDGVDVLAMGRETGGRGRPQPEQLSAVLTSASRSHDVVVVDLPRTFDPASHEVLRRADQVVLVVRADVRGVAAARSVAERLADLGRPVGIVVRLGRSRALDPATVGEALGLPVLGAAADEAAVVADAERGDPPGRSGRGELARVCRQVLGHLDRQATAA